jgi:hypothetical protein
MFSPIAASRSLVASLTIGGIFLSCGSGDTPPPVTSMMDAGCTPAPSDAGGSDMELAACVASGQVGSPRDTCSPALPTDGDCATASPTYADVAPIFESRCQICHHPGGTETSIVLSNYAAIHDNMTRRLDIFTQIRTRRMPPPCAPDVKADEMSTLLKWFVCGAPQGGDAAAF